MVQRSSGSPYLQKGLMDCFPGKEKLAFETRGNAPECSICVYCCMCVFSLLAHPQNTNQKHKRWKNTSTGASGLFVFWGPSHVSFPYMTFLLISGAMDQTECSFSSSQSTLSLALVSCFFDASNNTVAVDPALVADQQRNDKSDRRAEPMPRASEA